MIQNKSAQKYVSWGLMMATMIIPNFSCLAMASPVSSDRLKELMGEAMESRKPMKDFWKVVHTQYGTDAIAPLLHIAEDEKERDEYRWASLFGIARLTGKQSLGVVRKFVNHKSWLMRDAALKTIAALDAKEMRPEIESALHDKALVIRTTAVDVIGHLKLTPSAPKLVEALFDPANYRRDKPLWIHGHILSTLRDLNYKRSAPRLVNLLEEKKDPQLRAQVIATLEHFTGKSFSHKSMNEQIYLWRRNTISEMTF